MIKRWSDGAKKMHKHPVIKKFYRFRGTWTYKFGINFYLIKKRKEKGKSIRNLRGQNYSRAYELSRIPR